MNDIKFYIDELLSNECACGREKKMHKFFCYDCYKSLPRDLQTNLHSPLHEGYEEAYDAAVKYLTETGRIE